jgi:hypothetical protein
MITKSSPADPCLKWNDDCLATVVILASCLSVSEMKKLLNKHPTPGQDLGAPAEVLLEALHEACHREPALVETITRKLDRKFSSALARVRGLAPGDLPRSLEDGQWPLPLMWACFRQPSPEFRNAGRRLAHRMIRQGMKHHLARPDAEELNRRLSEADQRRRALEQALQKLRAENRRLRREQWLREASAGAAAPRPLRAAPNPGKEAARLRKQLKGLEDRNRAMAGELASWRKLALSREKAGSKPGFGQCLPACPISCRAGDGDQAQCGRKGEECPLAGRRIAIIGGLDRLEPRYRESVDQLGGKCICHTGKIRGGCRRLKQTVAKADLVVFITTINSHAALSTVKSECKRCSTPFCALGRSGAGSLEQALLKWAV